MPKSCIKIGTIPLTFQDASAATKPCRLRFRSIFGASLAELRALAQSIYKGHYRAIWSGLKTASDRLGIFEDTIMNNSSRHALRVVLRIDFPPDDRLGHGKMELLEHIRETGSISAAGRAMDMSYRRAWLLVSDLNRMFREPVVESQRGGQKGGGAALTEFGEQLIRRFRTMEKVLSQTLSEELGWLEANRSEGGASPRNED
jgi:molybdate transport system regulatory protein